MHDQFFLIKFKSKCKHDSKLVHLNIRKNLKFEIKINFLLDNFFDRFFSLFVFSVSGELF